MLVLSRSPTATPAPDRLRGTTQRWSVDAGPLAGNLLDLAFNADWSVDWRVVAGARQGRAGRAREFVLQPVRSSLFAISFPIGDGEAIAATIDFASRRFVGFVLRDGLAAPMCGALQST